MSVSGLIEQKLSRKTVAQRAGLRYEQKAVKHLEAELRGIEIGVWWEWYEGKTTLLRRMSQTDGFWLNPDRDIATIFEIKHHHTSDAWWQLREYYVPIVRAYLGPRVNINCVEVCKTFDPAVKVPDPIYLIESGALADWCSRVQPPDAFGVYRWRP